jgi:hypothetical protein
MTDREALDKIFETAATIEDSMRQADCPDSLRFYMMGGFFQMLAAIHETLKSA